MSFPWPRRWNHLALLTGSILAPGAFLGYAWATGGLGFPLDDAWIHQTYARNLARYGSFAFVPGQPSAGSTSPLWSLLLSLGYVLRLDYRLWAFLLGALSLYLTGLLVYRLGERLFPFWPQLPLVAGLFCVLEWHLAWAALSGMEISLFCLLALLLMTRRGRGEGGFALGLLGGLLTLTRPEGLMLVGLVALATLAEEREGGKAIRSLGGMALGLALPLAPYFAFNLLTTGCLFPNTFYAKQAEYRELVITLPIWARLLRVLRPTLVGAQVLLIPGFVYEAVQSLRRIAEREYAPLLPLAWWGATAMAYALRLPVDYQHGRYLMPVIPVFVLYGLAGSFRLLGLLPAGFARRVLSRGFTASLSLLLLAFVLLGARAYATDVRIIESEMVEVAKWLRDNTPPGSLVAAHDIGAIGYWAQRPLVDLAGLVTPEVIPFIRDEESLLAYLEARRPDYLVTFPSWYPHLTSDPRLQLLYTTSSPWTRAAGGENMAVYRCRWSDFNP